MPSRFLQILSPPPSVGGNGFKPSFQHSYPVVEMSAVASSPSQTALILAFAIAGGITCLVVLILSILIIYYRFKGSRTSPFDPSNPIRLQKFSYRELKAATNSFGIENKLGQGGFGPVYKGILRNGQVVAVKSLDSASLQGEREFQNEMLVIGGVRSSHIVGLLGFCAERKRRLLVYEYMAHRSLQEALFDEEYPVDLDWKMRLKIIVDIAQALVFLHSSCDPPIIHGDIKPSNVLLDGNFTAKIADFGLSRVKTEVPSCLEVRSEEIERETSVDPEKVRLDRVSRDKERRHQKKQKRKGEKCSEKPLQCKCKEEHVVTGTNEGHGGAEGDEVAVSKPEVCEQALETKLNEKGNAATDDGVTTAGEDTFSFHCECPVSNSIGDDACWKIESQRVLETGVFNVNDNAEQHLGNDDHAGFGLDIDQIEQSNEKRNQFPVPLDAVECEKKERKAWRSKDWWWKQESTIEDDNTIKAYTVDWLAGEVKSGGSRSRDWGFRDDVSTGSAENQDHRDCSKNKETKGIGEERSPSMVWCGQCFGQSSFKDRISQRLSSNKQQQNLGKDECSREFSGQLTKSREWWKEEYLEELSNKSRELKGERCKKNSRSRDISWSFDFSGDLSNKPQAGREWWSGDLLHWIHRSKGESGTIDFSGDLNGHSRELRSRDRTWSRDGWSGELASRAVSSTTSMRGTVCYVAPEYGGGGILSEKSDVYSFGVLMLVIISGRRPLQVVSPNVEFERANLISWGRHLAQNGDVLELVDSSLRGEFSKDQATLCIMVALQCLQRLPAVRPSMAEVMRILAGESQLPPSLPELFSPSPSPPCNLSGFQAQWKLPPSTDQAGELPLLAS